MGTTKYVESPFHIECIESSPTIHDPQVHDTFLIYYCQRGRFTNYLKNSTAHFIHGDIVIIPPGTAYHISVDVPCTVYFVITFSNAFIDTHLPNNETSCSFLHSLQSGQYIYPKVSLPPEEIVFFEGTIDKILSEFTESKIGYDDVIKNSLLSLITVLSRIYSAQNSEAFARSYSKKEAIKYCISYIDAHCCEKITLSEITKLSAMSKAVFCDLFKKQTGLSFKDYLNRKRIQKALALLKTEDNITEISYACGYNEFTTFYRNFIKFTGLTPQQYRQKHIKHSNEHPVL